MGTGTRVVLATLMVGCGSSAPTAAPEQAEAPATTVVAPAAGAPEAMALAASWTGSFAAIDLGLPEAGARDVVVEDGRPLLVVDEERFVVVTGDGAPRIEANPVGFRLASYGSDHPLPRAGGAFLMWARDGIAAVDRQTRRVRWTAPEGDGPASVKLRSAGDAFVLAGISAMRALDPVDGRELWTHEDIANGGFARAGRGVVLIEDWDADAVVALDARTGAERFRVPVPSPRVGPISQHGFGVVNEEARHTLVVVGLDGAVRRRFTLDAPVDDHLAIAVGERDVTVLVRPDERAADVRRYDLETGRMSARSDRFGSTGVGDGELVIADGGVLVRDGGTLRVLNAELRETWLGQPIGGCARVSGWTAPNRAPAFVCGGPVSFYRASAARARRSITMRGVVRCDGRPLPDAPVQVGGALTRTGADGRYRVEATFDEPRLYVSVPYSVWLDDVVRCEYQGRFVEPDADAMTEDFALELAAGGLDGL